MEKKRVIVIISVVLVIFLLLIGLFFILQNEEELIYVCQSNSMLPGIKLGDQLIYEKIQNKGDIITYGVGEATDYEMFGDYGDVIIYRPYGGEGDPIVHRAMGWIQYHEEYSTYSVGEYGLNNVASITISELGLDEYKPTHSGFITKGDNNDACDQLYTQLCSEPVKVEWIIGKVISIKE